MAQYTVMTNHDLPEVVEQIIDSRGLKVLHVFQRGPRYAAVLVEQNGKEAVLKVALPLASGQRNNDERERSRLVHRNIDKEILWLQFLGEWVPTSAHEKFMFTELMDYSDSDIHWYLREALPGTPMAEASNPFPLPQLFYETIKPQLIFDFFRYIHSISREVPPQLSSMFWHRWTKYDQYDHFARWINGMLPKVAEGHEYLGPILDYVARHKFIVEAADTVLIHQEPYASHIFFDKGRIGLIDWENLDFGHKLYDLSVIWMRAFDDPAWQSELLRVMQHEGYLTPTTQRMWDLEILLQSIGNLVYFQTATIGSEEYHKHGKAFFRANIERILADT